MCFCSHSLLKQQERAVYVGQGESRVQGKNEITHFVAQHVQKVRSHTRTRTHNAHTGTLALLLLFAVDIAVAQFAVQKLLCAQLSLKAAVAAPAAKKANSQANWSCLSISMREHKTWKNTATVGAASVGGKYKTKANTPKSMQNIFTMPTHSGVCKGDSYLDSQKTIGRGGREHLSMRVGVCVRVWA